MTLNELNLIYFDARKKLQDELSARHEDDISTEPHLAGIRAVVEALRDEMTLGWEDDRPWGDVADVKKFLNKILASDGEEAAGGSTREDGRPSSGVLVRSNTADGLKAPAADLLIIDGAGKFTEEQWQYLHSSAATAEDLAIFGMAVSRVDGNGNVTRINSAEMFKDPNVCEWTRIDEDVLESGCDPDGWTYNPEIKRDTCPQCGKPISFKSEAAR